MSSSEPPPYPGDDAGLPSYGSIPPPPPGGGTPPPPPPGGGTPPPPPGGPPGWPPPYSSPMPAPPTNGLAIASLILGIVSILGLCCYGVPGLLFGIAAIVCGQLAKNAILASSGAQGGAGMAKAGLIMGIIGIVIGVIAIVVIVLFVAAGGLDSVPADY